MSTSQRTRVYIACSLDGFIAGPDDDLSWLPEPPEGCDDDFGWGAFMAGIGCFLTGRRTFDVVMGMGVDWPHTEIDTLIATHRPLADAPPRVSTVSGTIQEIVHAAKQRAAPRDVYIDGGDLIRQALDAELIDELIVTVCPNILGSGRALFAGADHRRKLELKSMRELPGGLAQLTYTLEPDT
ncbi:MAG: dihydrofolate reductase [Planctomycetota bacterium]|nr:MAG: dihydrofolate reductase [Planctomycetota bacterium]